MLCDAVLVLDRGPELSDLVRDAGYPTLWERDPGAAAKADFVPSIAMVDIDGWPGDAGIDLCRQFSLLWASTPVIAVTRRDELNWVLRAMRNGVADLIRRPLSAAAVRDSIRRVRCRHHVHGHGLSTKGREMERSVDLIGSSRAMRSLRAGVRMAATSNVAVLVVGERGVGKKLVARAVHHNSSRRDGPFVSLTCASAAHDSFEREDHGGESRDSRKSLLRSASGGTLFLDEIAALSLSMQAKLYRLLDHGAGRARIDHRQALDIRLVASTRSDLAAEVAARRFRRDLFDRISCLEIRVPPLRDRREDVGELASHFIRRCSTTLREEKLSPDAIGAAMRYHWPGNVRELQRAIEHAVSQAEHEELTAAHLPQEIRRGPRQATRWDPLEPASVPTLRELRHSYIHEVLSATAGNQTRTSQILGISRRTVHRRLACTQDEQLD